MSSVAPRRAPILHRSRPWLGLTAALLALPLTACEDTAGGIGRVSGKVTTEPTIDFGAVQVGLVSTYELELNNEGSIPVRIESVETATTFTAATHRFDVDLARDGLAIATQGSVKVRVTFQPLVEMESPVESSFSFVTDLTGPEGIDGPKVKVTVTVRGRGVRTGLVVEPNPVDFGAVLVGSSVTMDVKITNALSVPIDVLSDVNGGTARITNQGRGRFELVNALHGGFGSLLPSGTLLDPGASVIAQITYTPDATDVSQGDVGHWIIRNCNDRLCEVDVTLRGRGTNTGLECAPVAIEFGDINPGRTATRTITCTNVSTGELTVADWGVSQATASELSVTPFPAGGVPVVGPGQSFNLEAHFSPTQATLGVHVTGTAVISTRSDSANVDLDTISIPLGGTGGGPTISVIPADLDFGRVAIGTTYSKRLLVENVGYSDLVVSSVAPDGPDAAMFVASLDTFTLATGTSTIIDVTFAPTAAGPIASDLVFLSNDGSTPELRVPMRGEGLDLPPCSYSLLPGSVTYGVVPVRQTAQQTVRFENLGTEDCLVRDVHLTGDNAFNLVGGNRQEELVPGGGVVDLPIDFVPVTPGNFSGQLEMYVSSPIASTPTVPLFGVGQAQTEVMCPPPITTPAGIPVTLTANVTTQGTNVVAYEWQITNAPNGGIGTPQQWSPDPPNAQTETFLPYIVGVYTIHLTVIDDAGNSLGCDTQVTAEGHGLRVQQTWDGSGDIDLHLHNPNTAVPWFTNPEDCYYANRTPLWNVAQPPALMENPELDFDNVTGFGPENIRIDLPQVGVPYTIGVHNFSGGAGRIVTIDIFCGGVTSPNQTFVSAPMNGSGAGSSSSNDFWKVATVVFQSQTSCTITPLNVVVPSSDATVNF